MVLRPPRRSRMGDGCMLCAVPSVILLGLHLSREAPAGTRFPLRTSSQFLTKTRRISQLMLMHWMR